MDFSTHQVTRRIINQTMPGNGVFAGKGCGDNLQIEVAAIFRAGMSSMAMRLILDVDGQRLECCQSLTQ